MDCLSEVLQFLRLLTKAVNNILFPKKINYLAYGLVLAICYMYVVAVKTYFSANSEGTDRARLLSAVIAVGILYIFRKQKIAYNKIINAAFLLTAYMFLLGFSSNSGFVSWISCAVMWFFVIVILYNVTVTIEDLRKISMIFCITDILLAVIYIRGIGTVGILHTVANTNSIYFVLGAMPFIFLCPVFPLKAVTLLASSAAIIISGKGTCILALLCIFAAAGRQYTLKRQKSSALTLARLTGMIIFVLGLSAVLRFFITKGIDNVVGEVGEELLSGGNGRLRIYLALLRAYADSSVFGQILGHGYHAVSNAINIGSHNDFLMVLYDYGLIGFTLYIILWIRLVQGIFVLKKHNSPYALAYVISVIVFFWISMASNVLNTQIQFLFLCVFWGLCSPGRRFINEKNSNYNG